MLRQWLGRLLPAKRGRWRKFDLLHAVAEIDGYRSLLEISTASTGGAHHSVDRSRFDLCQRLAYAAPDDWSDKAPVEYRSRDLDTSECMRRIRERGLRFDMVFIDAWHEYETARRDLQSALELIGENGIVVAHDCLPEREDGCSAYREGKFLWWGVSYKLYVDFLLSRNDLWYCTVDTDYGCGMVRKRQKSDLYRRAEDVDPDLARAWQAIGDDYTAAYRFYQLHRRSLMNVVSVDEFLAAERQSADVWMKRAASEPDSQSSADSLHTCRP